MKIPRLDVVIVVGGGGDGVSPVENVYGVMESGGDRFNLT